MKKPNILTIVLVFVFMAGSCKGKQVQTEQEKKQPNILFAITDDQSFPYASVYGEYGVKTPAFDKVAQQGVLFTNAAETKENIKKHLVRNKGE